MGSAYLLTLSAVAEPAPHPMTVCSLVQHIKALEGQIVSVHGVLIMYETDPEGATPHYMVADCPSLNDRRVRVKIEYPDSWFLKNPPTGYRVDQDSFRRAWKVIIGTMEHGKVKSHYIATIVGQANSVAPYIPPPPNLHVTLEGKWDADIVIQGIYDLKVPSK